MKKTSKVLLVLFATVLSVPSHSNEKNYPCSGKPGSYHTNPDSSLGGFVASTATVDATVTISPESSVCERATVLEGVILNDQSTVTGKATVRGKVLIKNRAKVHGESYVFNASGGPLMIQDDAQIYGHGFLLGSVIVAGNSQVFGWGKVIEYAQVLGSSIVCGNSIVKGYEVLQDDETTKCAQ